MPLEDKTGAGKVSLHRDWESKLPNDRRLLDTATTLDRGHTPKVARTEKPSLPFLIPSSYFSECIGKLPSAS